MSKFNFKNKVAIVTGSSLGIGKAIALALAEKGVKVVINGRDETKLQRAKDYLESQNAIVLAVTCDITRPDDCQMLVDKTLAEFSQIDIVVNNAGTSMRGSFAEVEPEVFRRIMDVNYLGAVYMTKAALPYLVKSKGSVVFISSLAGIRGLPFLSAYSSAKMALTALVESLKIELSDTGIHVGVVYVGFTEIEDEKRIIGADGKMISLAARSSSKAQSLVKVAGSVVRVIEKKQFSRVLTTMGKINWLANKLIPRLIDRVFIIGKKKFIEGMK